MQRERVAEDIYIFVSDLYAQVTATVIATREGAVLFDTLLYPEETRMIKRFVENRLGMSVRYIVNSHYHADHTAGTCLFENAHVIAHARCRELLDKRGRDGLERAKDSAPELREVEITLPNLIFESGMFSLYIGGKCLQFWHSPGHSPDSIVCLVKEDRVLLGADTLMPIPYFADGSYDDFVRSLEALRDGNFEHVIQGHGEIILRGEVEEKLQSDLDYLAALRAEVDAALAGSTPEKLLDAIDIERCGKSRILLNGTVEALHRHNVQVLAAQRREAMQI